MRHSNKQETAKTTRNLPAAALLSAFLGLALTSGAAAQPQIGDAQSNEAAYAAGLTQTQTSCTARLPAVDSIDGKTDIRAFMHPCVPDALRVAALRRAWSLDPMIRDFKGMAENDWDFTAEEPTFGFGKLGPEIDIPAMVAEILSSDQLSDGRVASKERFSLPSQVSIRAGSLWDAPAILRR